MSSNELAVVEATATPANLFAADTPQEVLKAAVALAEPLGEMIRANGMVTVIGSKRGTSSEHTNIEGWQVAGAMLGISAHTVWTKPLEGNTGWEARAEARTRTGDVVGSAEAMCTRDERGNQWRHADQQALRSMAQTRAQSKALASVLRFVMTLTGTSGTPVEEVTEAEVPTWARPAPDLHEVVRACADVLGGSLDMELATTRATELVKRIYDDCGQEVPMIVWQAFTMLLAAMVSREPDEALEAEQPEVSSEIVPKSTSPEDVNAARVAEREADLREEADLEAAGMDVYGSLPATPESTTEETQ